MQPQEVTHDCTHTTSKRGLSRTTNPSPTNLTPHSTEHSKAITGGTNAENEKRKTTLLKVGGKVVTPNAPKPKKVGTTGNAEDPPAMPTILTKQQQKKVGTPFMEGKQSINRDFNKQRAVTKRAKNTDNTSKHGQNTMIHNLKAATSMTIPEEEK